MAFIIDKSKKKIGEFNEKLIRFLNLEIPVGTPIYIGSSNIEHIKSRHPYEYDKYFSDIRDILATPDYAGINPHDGSVLFVRLYEIDKEYIRVAVKVTAYGNCYAKTLHLLSTYNAERYIEKGTLKKLDKQ